ncbi:hypothetical protein J2S13_002839 [Oikeobacillus pervagus]|uniref:Uncharacterized protein n=1 Tax=Oikeobacillus pervagus TaxID=1325931 RepID=A0AAJ1T755_9BACI|nr:hypothetical protein [Oikeobacillus pervagus]
MSQTDLHYFSSDLHYFSEYLNISQDFCIFPANICANPPTGLLLSAGEVDPGVLIISHSLLTISHADLRLFSSDLHYSLGYLIISRDFYIFPTNICATPRRVSLLSAGEVDPGVLIISHSLLTISYADLRLFSSDLHYSLGYLNISQDFCIFPVNICATPPTGLRFSAGEVDPDVLTISHSLLTISQTDLHYFSSDLHYFPEHLNISQDFCIFPVNICATPPTDLRFSVDSIKSKI